MQHANSANQRAAQSYGRQLVSLLLLAFSLLLPAASAQAFDGARFLEQCLRLEAGQDYVSARESCLNALQLNPDDTTALLALARIEIQLGQLGSAEDRLLQLRSRVDSAEPALLLAETALARGDLAL